MALYFKRILNFALTDFYRNRGTSVAAIFVLIITTLLITSLFMLHGMSDFLISTIQNKIDVTAYFKDNTSEADILAVRDEILQKPGIKSVEYVSKEEALTEFMENHEGNEIFDNALQEVGGNPFLPALNITTAGNTDQYQQISNVLESDEYSQFVDKVDFSEKKDTIEKVFRITSNVNRFAIVLGLLLIIIAAAVVFNTIKLVIDSSKDEISTMTIVGASSWFVRAPFILEGAIFGAISFLVSFLITFLFSYSLSRGVASFMPGFDLFDYFMSNLWLVILLQLASGVGLAALSSFVVVRKYLDI